MAVTTTSFFAPISGSLPGVLASAGDIRKELLGLSPKSPVIPKIIPAGTEFLSIAFVAEQPVGPEEWKTEKESFIQGLVERKRLAAVDAFLAERMKQAKLTINPEALK